jgi:hypothetical protein
LLLSKNRLRFVVVFLIAAIVLALYWAIEHVTDSLTGPEHVFELDDAPPFLTDELALSKAAEALALDKFGNGRWEPKEDGRTISPDNKRDKYLSRNALNANQGSILFIDRLENTRARFVSVKLDGNRIICRVTKPK